MLDLVLIGFDVGFILGCVLEYLLLKKLKMLKEEY